MSDKAVGFRRRPSSEAARPQRRGGTLRTCESANLHRVGKIDGLIEEARSFLTRVEKQVGAELKFVAVAEDLIKRRA